MNRRAVSGVMLTLFLTSVFTFSLVGVCLLGLRVVYASPYTDMDVDTAYDMTTNGSYPYLVALDVRTKSEYDSGHIYDAVWIPHTELEARIDELTDHENHEIIVYCKSGGRSAMASGILDSHSFTKVYNMLGGIQAWQSAGHPVWIGTVHNLNTTFNYDTIQAAIDAPQTLDGHAIFVETGIYYENVVINKALSLIGEDQDITLIDGSKGTHGSVVINIKADGVLVSGFTIQNGSHSNIMTWSNTTRIIGNRIANNTWMGGIYVQYSADNSICCNVFISNARAIYLYWSTSVNNLVANNTIINGGLGIHVQYSSKNNISANNIRDNDYGIWLHGSSNNSIYYNNFVNNREQVYSDGLANVWDNGYPSGGNYWSDYASVDVKSGPYQNETGSDGIGDTPYVVYENNLDRYPLMYPIIEYDFNYDGTVDMKDIAIAATAYGSFPGHPRWNSLCDLNDDAKVDLVDIYKMAKNFGKTC